MRQRSVFFLLVKNDLFSQDSLMITIDNVKTLKGSLETVTFESSENYHLDGKGKLILLPALVDLFSRLLQGGSVKWPEDPQELLKAGVSTIFEPLSEKEITSSLSDLSLKLAEYSLPLAYYPLFAVTPKNQILLPMLKKQLAVVSVFPSLFTTVPKQLDELYRLLAQEQLLAIVDCRSLSEMEQQIALAEKYKTPLVVHPITSPQSLALVKKARDRAQLIWSATSISLLLQQGKWLFKEIEEGQIDLIHSGKNPTAFLSKLLQAHLQCKLSLHKIAELTRINAETIFNLPASRSFTLVSLEKCHTVYTISQGQLFIA